MSSVLFLGALEGNATRGLKAWKAKSHSEVGHIGWHVSVIKLFATTGINLSRWANEPRREFEWGKRNLANTKGSTSFGCYCGLDQNGEKSQCGFNYLKVKMNEEDAGCYSSRNPTYLACQIEELFMTQTFMRGFESQSGEQKAERDNSPFTSRGCCK